MNKLIMNKLIMNKLIMYKLNYKKKTIYYIKVTYNNIII